MGVTLGTRYLLMPLRGNGSGGSGSGGFLFMPLTILGNLDVGFIWIFFRTQALTPDLNLLSFSSFLYLSSSLLIMLEPL